MSASALTPLAAFPLPPGEPGLRRKAAAAESPLPSGPVQRALCPPAPGIRRRPRSVRGSRAERHLVLDPGRVLLELTRLRRELDDALLAVERVLPPDGDVLP